MLWLAVHLPLLPLEVFNNEPSTTPDANKKEEKPLASLNEKPLASLNKEPSASLNEEPLASLNKEPSASLNKNPLAIYEERRGRNLISYCNQSAIEQGIEPGMSDSSAIALCHDIKLIARDIDKEKQLLQQLAETAYEFSSQVTLYTTQNNTFYHSKTHTFKNIQSQQHSLLLEVSRSLKLFGGLDRLIHLLAQRFTTHPLSASGFCYQLATAKSFLFSEVFARSLYAKKQETEKTSKTAALQNTVSQQAISKQSISKQADLEQQAAYIPITLLDCDSNSKQQCEAMGLHSLAALLNIPRDTLGRRFNKNLIQYLNQLDGNVFLPPPLFSPPDVFYRELFFVHGLRSHDDLHQPMQKLLEELNQFLRFRQQISTGIRWRFFRFSKKSHYLRVYFSRPQMQVEEMLALSQLQLPQLPMDSPVESISLSAKQFLAIHDSSESNIESGDLLSFSVKKNAAEIALPNGDQRLLKDRILARLGNTALYQTERHSCFLPEHKSSYAQLSYLKPKPTARFKKTDLEQTDLDHTLPSKHKRPTWLMESPVEVKLKKNRDNHLQGFINNQSCHLHILKGPERLTTQWWDKQQQRDYFIAGKVAPQTTHYSAIYWLYQDCLNGKWFLQGVFS